MLREDTHIIDYDFDQEIALKASLSLPKNLIGLALMTLPEPVGEEAKDLMEESIEQFFEEGIGTLLFHPLNEHESSIKGNAYNINLLARRIEHALDWVSRHKHIHSCPVGLFASGPMAAAAAKAAARSKHKIAALISKGGRIDMAQKYLPYVDCPCLLIVGEKDELSLKANSKMLENLQFARLHIIKNADHELLSKVSNDEISLLSCRWFRRYFNKERYQESEQDYRLENMKLPFYDRIEAAHFLARSLRGYQSENPLVLAIPRRAVAMADVVSTELDCDMDVILVKKIKIPKGYGMGAGSTIGSVNEFGDVYLASNAKEYGDEEAISRLAADAQKSLRDYRTKLGAKHEPTPYAGRTVIIIDDGIATGSTMLSAVITAKEKGAQKVVVAAPVVSSSAQKMLRLASDETLFLNIPENFYAVAQFYENYPQVGDGEVEHILR